MCQKSLPNQSEDTPESTESLIKLVESGVNPEWLEWKPAQILSRDDWTRHTLKVNTPKARVRVYCNFDDIILLLRFTILIETSIKTWFEWPLWCKIYKIPKSSCIVSLLHDLWVFFEFHVTSCNSACWVSLFWEHRRLAPLPILPYRDSSLLNSAHMLTLAITLKPHQVYSWLWRVVELEALAVADCASLMQVNEGWLWLDACLYVIRLWRSVCVNTVMDSDRQQELGTASK